MGDQKTKQMKHLIPWTPCTSFSTKMPKAMLFESLKTPGTATYVTLYLQLRMESEGLYRDPRTKIIRTRW